MAARAVGMLADPSAATPDFHARVLAQARFRGTGRALLSTRRSMPPEVVELYRRIGHSGTPVLIVWGQEDRITPFANHALAREVMPGAGFLAVDGAGHAAQYERPEVVNPAMVEFLTRA